MKIATLQTAGRLWPAAQSRLAHGFSSGLVMGMVVVGLGLLDTSLWYTVLRYVFVTDAMELANTMICFGMGASSMALFARWEAEYLQSRRRRSRRSLRQGGGGHT